MIDPRKSGSFASHGEKEHDVVCGEQGKRGFGGLEQRHSERRVEMKRVASDFWSFGYRYAWVKKASSCEMKGKKRKCRPSGDAEVTFCRRPVSAAVFRASFFRPVHRRGRT